MQVRKHNKRPSVLVTYSNLVNCWQIRSSGGIHQIIYTYPQYCCKRPVARWMNFWQWTMIDFFITSGHWYTLPLTIYWCGVPLISTVRKTCFPVVNVFSMWHLIANSCTYLDVHLAQVYRSTTPASLNFRPNCVFFCVIVHFIKGTNA
jgi:hypothetical protein